MKHKSEEKKSILIKLYRMYRFLYIHHFRILTSIIYKLTCLLLGCYIPPTVDLGSGVNFGHPIGIVIHQNSKVGKNTIIYQNVTLGRKDRSNQLAPIIGDNCIIGAGACILGNVVIGKNVTVGANAVVVTDIPDGCTVVGVPGKIIKGLQKNE